jgi:ribosome biogenesis GTPase
MTPIDVDALEDDWESEGVAVPRGRPRASVAARERRAREGLGRVVALDRGHVEVLVDGERLVARYGGGMRGVRVAVGDEVRVARSARGGEARLVARDERRTVLARSGDDLEDDERVVVANADAVVCVVGVDNLEAGLRFADRVLVAASLGGLAAVLVVNKIDLAESREAVEAAVAPYRRAVEHVVLTSATTGEGLDELARVLFGRWSALTGHSGVGKSSLTNRLVPEAARAVGALGRRGGRHTTVAARALPLVDGWLVDTPGVRSFGLGALAPGALARHFPELATLACELDDCTHDGEPGCALEPAALPAVRLAAYRRLLAALRAGGEPEEAVGPPEPGATLSGPPAG